MFRYINRRATAALMAFVVVLSNVLVPAGQAFAANGNATYQPVWCQFTGNQWKIQIGNSNNNQNRFALNMTDAIRNLNDANIQTGIANGQQVMDSDQNDRLDPNFCVQQFSLTIPTPTITGVCGLNNDTVTVPNSLNYTWSFSGWTNSQGTVTVTANSPYAFTDGNTTEVIPVTEQDTAACVVTITQLPQSTVTGVCGLDNDIITVGVETSQYSAGAITQVFTNGVAKVTYTAKAGFVFPGGATTYVETVNEVDTASCVTTIPVPPTPSVNDPCGLNNASWIVPANTAQYTWFLANGDLVATAAQNFIFANGQTTVHYGLALDSGVLCQATPAPVIFTDLCGMKNDTFTIPSAQGVIYEVNGTPTAAGTYPGKGTVVITTIAAPNYMLTAPYTKTIVFSKVPCKLKEPVVTVITPEGCVPIGVSNRVIDVKVRNPNGNAVVYKVVINGTAQTVIIPGHSTTTLAFSGLGAGTYTIVVFQHRKDHDDNIVTLSTDTDDKWESVYSQTVTLEACPPIQVTPVAPSFYDYCGNATDYIFIPSERGVTYKVNGVVVGSGFQAVSGAVTVTATANSGYVISEDATASWSFTFTDAACITITKSFVSFTDTNRDGRTDYGDTANWLITVTNNSNASNSNEIRQSFNVQVTDPSATTLENGGVVTGLAPGQSVSLTATTVLAPVAGAVQTVCTASNTATFTANQVVIDDEEFLSIGRQSPQLTGSASADATFTCPAPGMGGSQPTPPSTELPHTGPEDLNLLPLGIIVAIIVYGAVYFAQPKKWYGQQ